LDQRKREVVRLEGSSGRLVWRQPLDQTPLGLVVNQERLYVVTAPGRVLALEARSGRLVQQAQLPQRAGSAPVLAGGQLCVLAERSTLFVLDPDSLRCRQTVFLGHRPGAVLVPPCALLDLVLVGESVSDEVALLSVIGPVAGGSLDVLGRPLRLKGRIATPLSVSGARVVVATDRGQLLVLERDASGNEPLRQVARLETSLAAPQMVWTHLERNWVWTSAERPALLELRPAVDQLSRRWTGTHQGACLGPLLTHRSIVVHVRRHRGVDGVQVEAMQLADGKPLWTTTLAAAPLAVASRSEACFLLSGDGRLYAVDRAALAGSTSFVVSSASATPAGGGLTLKPHVAASDDGRWWVATSEDGGQVLRYELGRPSRVSVLPMSPAASAPAVLWGEALAAGASDGTVVRRPWEATTSELAVFLPPLVVDRVPRWGQPAVLPGQALLAAVSDAGELYVLRERAQTRGLELVAQRSLGGPIVGPWAASGAAAIGVVRRPAHDVLVGLDAQGHSAFPEIPLRGRVMWGPYAATDTVLVASELDGLVCVEASGKVRWQQPLRYGPLVGPVLRCEDGDWIGLAAAGMVVRWESQHGREQARQDVGEPLAGPAAWWGDELVVAASDGTLHVLPPPRP
jgi:outer membrane protein assembly factor BamB